MSAAAASDPVSDPQGIIQEGVQLGVLDSDVSVTNDMLEHLLEVLGEEEFRRALQGHTGEGMDDVSMTDATDSTAVSSSACPELYTEKVFDSACAHTPESNQARQHSSLPFLTSCSALARNSMQNQNSHVISLQLF